MNGQKKLIFLLSLLFVFVLVILVVAYFSFIRDSDTGDQNSFDEENIVVVSESTVYEIDKYEDLIKSNRDGDHQRSLELSRQFAENDSNPQDQRLIAYDICLESAITIEDNSAKDDCYQRALVLIEEVSHEEAKKEWATKISNRYNGVQPEYTEEFEEDELR